MTTLTLEHTLEQRLDAAIAHTGAVIAANNAYLAELEAWYAEALAILPGQAPTLHFTPEELDALDEEQPGSSESTQPWLW
jgi:hypothetical protein